MTDLELFKAIVRATRDVAVENVPKAVAKVREILGISTAAPSSSREITGDRSGSGRNRKHLGGYDRSGDDAA